jgi:hypothetical protein
MQVIEKIGGPCRTRTYNQLIKSLCDEQHLSARDATDFHRPKRSLNHPGLSRFQHFLAALLCP